MSERTAGKQIETLGQLERVVLVGPHESPLSVAREIAKRWGLPVWLHADCRQAGCYSSWGDPECKFPPPKGQR